MKQSRSSVSVVLVVAMATFCLSPPGVVGLKTFRRADRSVDPHGGVKMGESRRDCDNAKDNLEVDWDPTSKTEYTCDDGVMLQPSEYKITRNCVNETHRPLHVCLPNEIHYPDDEIPPTSGAHRPLWPDYGEYVYVPPQRWLHNLEHGAIVFLYHPCANPSEVEKMRQVATSCLRKHIITPYKQLPLETPYAALSWGCKLLMSHVQTSILRRFVKNHAKHSPEGNVASKGQYSEALKVPAKIVSDYYDREICPDDNNEDAETSPMDIEELMRAASGNSNLPSDTSRLRDSRIESQRNPFVLQSEQRRRHLNSEADKLHQNVQRLILAYKRLVGSK